MPAKKSALARQGSLSRLQGPRSLGANENGSPQKRASKTVKFDQMDEIYQYVAPTPEVTEDNWDAMSLESCESDFDGRPLPILPNFITSLNLENSDFPDTENGSLVPLTYSIGGDPNLPAKLPNTSTYASREERLMNTAKFQSKLGQPLRSADDDFDFDQQILKLVGGPQQKQGRDQSSSPRENIGQKSTNNDKDEEKSADTLPSPLQSEFSPVIEQPSMELRMDAIMDSTSGMSPALGGSTWSSSSSRHARTGSQMSDFSDGGEESFFPVRKITIRESEEDMDAAQWRKDSALARQDSLQDDQRHPETESVSKSLPAPPAELDRTYSKRRKDILQLLDPHGAGVQQNVGFGSIPEEEEEEDEMPDVGSKELPLPSVSEPVMEEREDEEKEEHQHYEEETEKEKEREEEEHRHEPESEILQEFQQKVEPEDDIEFNKSDTRRVEMDSSLSSVSDIDQSIGISSMAAAQFANRSLPVMDTTINTSHMNISRMNTSHMNTSQSLNLSSFGLPTLHNSDSFEFGLFPSVSAPTIASSLASDASLTTNSVRNSLPGESPRRRAADGDSFNVSRITYYDSEELDNLASPASASNLSAIASNSSSPIKRESRLSEAFQPDEFDDHPLEQHITSSSSPLGSPKASFLRELSSPKALSSPKSYSSPKMSSSPKSISSAKDILMPTEADLTSPITPIQDSSVAAVDSSYDKKQDSEVGLSSQDLPSQVIEPLKSEEHTPTLSAPEPRRHRAFPGLLPWDPSVESLNMYTAKQLRPRPATSADVEDSRISEIRSSQASLSTLASAMPTELPQLRPPIEFRSLSLKDVKDSDELSDREYLPPPTNTLEGAQADPTKSPSKSLASARSLQDLSHMDTSVDTFADFPPTPEIPERSPERSRRSVRISQLPREVSQQESLASGWEPELSDSSIDEEIDPAVQDAAVDKSKTLDATIPADESPEDTAQSQDSDMAANRFIQEKVDADPNVNNYELKTKQRQVSNASLRGRPQFVPSSIPTLSPIKVSNSPLMFSPLQEGINSPETEPQVYHGPARPLPEFQPSRSYSLTNVTESKATETHKLPGIPANSPNTDQRETGDNELKIPHLTADNASLAPEMTILRDMSLNNAEFAEFNDPRHSVSVIDVAIDNLVDDGLTAVQKDVSNSITNTNALNIHTQRKEDGSDEAFVPTLLTLPSLPSLPTLPTNEYSVEKSNGIDSANSTTVDNSYLTSLAPADATADFSVITERTDPSIAAEHSSRLPDISTEGLPLSENSAAAESSVAGATNYAPSSQPHKSPAVESQPPSESAVSPALVIPSPRPLPEVDISIREPSFGESISSTMRSMVSERFGDEHTAARDIVPRAPYTLRESGSYVIATSPERRQAHRSLAYEVFDEESETDVRALGTQAPIPRNRSTFDSFASTLPRAPSAISRSESNYTSQYGSTQFNSAHFDSSQYTSSTASSQPGPSQDTMPQYESSQFGSSQFGSSQFDAAELQPQPALSVQIPHSNTQASTRTHSQRSLPTIQERMPMNRMPSTLEPVVEPIAEPESPTKNWQIDPQISTQKNAVMIADQSGEQSDDEQMENPIQMPRIRPSFEKVTQSGSQSDRPRIQPTMAPSVALSVSMKDSQSLPVNKQYLEVHSVPSETPSVVPSPTVYPVAASVSPISMGSHRRFSDTEQMPMGILYLQINSISLNNCEQLPDNTLATLFLDNGVHCVASKSLKLNELAKFSEGYRIGLMPGSQAMATIKLEQPRSRAPPAPTGDSSSKKAFMTDMGSDGSYAQFELSPFQKTVFGKEREMDIYGRNQWSSHHPVTMTMSVKALYVPCISRKEVPPSSMEKALSRIEAARQSLANRPPRSTGVLRQFGGDISHPKGKQRYCVLDPVSPLLVIQSARNRRPRALINLAKATEVVKLGGNSLELRFKNKESLAFQAPNAQQVQTWQQELQNAIGKHGARPKWVDAIIYG